MKATGGGRFDPDEEYAYFIASSPNQHIEPRNILGPVVQEYPHILIAVNEMRSGKEFEKVDRLIDQGRKVLIDSGVFNLAASHARANGISHNEALNLPPSQVDGFEELFERYCLVADRYRDTMWGMIEIDQGGFNYKPTTRARIEAEAGIIPIPVWHPLLDGIDYYHELVAEYDRICVGNLVQAPPVIRLRIFAALADLARTNDTWHHLLGVTPNEHTISMPVKGSSDSSSWLVGARWPPSWFTTYMGKNAGGFGRDFWYDIGQKPAAYYPAMAVGMNEAAASQQTIRDCQETYSTW